MTRQASPLVFVLFWTMTAVVTQLLATAALSHLGIRFPWGIPLEAIGQLLVLSIVVSWQWWWALATVGGGILGLVLAPTIFTGEVSIASALAIVTALPQWFVLRRYGRRSLVWLAVPVVTVLAVSVVYRLFGPPRIVLGSGSSLEWVPRVAMTGVIVGLIEGAALAWILASAFEQTVSAVAAPMPQPRAPMAVTSRIAGVRMSLGVLIALVLPIFAPKLFLETFGFPDPDMIPFALAAATPWAAALALLWRPGLHHAGLALAATASIITLIGMIPLMVLVTLFSGWVLGRKDESVMYAGAMAATVMLLIVAVQSIRAVRSLSDSERLAWAWPASVAGAIVYGMVLLTVLS